MKILRMAGLVNRWVRFCFFIGVICLPAVVSAQVEDYIQEPMVLPVHTQPNQLHLSVGYGDGYGLAGSYSVNNRWAVFASGKRNTISSRSFSIPFQGSKTERNTYNFTGGVGFLLPTKREGNVAEILMGGGLFNLNNRRYSPIQDGVFENTQAAYKKIFGQLHLIKIKKHYELGGVLRIPYNWYTNYQMAEVHKDLRIDRGFENVWGVNLEPAVSFSAKAVGFKLNVQFGYSIRFLESSEKLYFVDDQTGNKVFYEDKEYQPDMADFIGSLSLQYNLNLGRKEK